jgi:hypothetical protein
VAAGLWFGVVMKPWEKEERRLASRRGGQLTPGSGSGWRKRNDVREGRVVLWEQKTTGNRQYTIKEDDWEQLRKHALSEGFIPALHITMGTKKRRLVLIEEADFDAAFPPDT